MVTHLIEEALELSDRIVAMKSAPGEVNDVLENHLSRPRNLRSEAFFHMEDKLKSLIKTSF
jgi:NitT/TauT family transport system ATP-binding protein